MEFIWEVFKIMVAVVVFVYVMRNGPELAKDVLKTIGVAIHAVSHAIRKVCIGYLRKEAGEAKEEAGEVKVEATVK